MRYLAVGLAALCVTVTSWWAVHETQAARHVRHQLASWERLRAQTDLAQKQTYQRVLPFDQNDTIAEYGAPFYLRMECHVTGSRQGPDNSRVPLDLNSTPRDGDVYRKDCTASSTSGPSG